MFQYNSSYIYRLMEQPEMCLVALRMLVLTVFVRNSSQSIKLGMIPITVHL